MFNQETRSQLLEVFRATANEGFKALKPQLHITKAMQDHDAAVVREGIIAIKDMILRATPEGIPAISHSYMYITPLSNDNGGSIAQVAITIRNKVDAAKQFSYRRTVLGDNIEDKVYSFLMDVYLLLAVDEMAQENLDYVNAVIGKAVKEAGVGYSVKLVTPLGCNATKQIAYLSDDEVVFVCDQSRIFDIDNMIVFMSEPNELVSEDRIKAVFSKLVDSFARSQTTVQLINAHGGDLIALLCDISRRVKPFTLISKVYSRNVLNASFSSDIGYYNKDGIFAVLAMNDGSLSVVLSPINVKTLEPADFDVLSAVAAC